MFVALKEDFGGSQGGYRWFRVWKLHYWTIHLRGQHQVMQYIPLRSKLALCRLANISFVEQVELEKVKRPFSTSPMVFPTTILPGLRLLM